MVRSVKKLTKKRIKIPSEINDKVRGIYPIAGYIFLAFTFFVDYTSTLIPLQLFNPDWEFQVMGKIINTVWAPFLGFSLVFFTRQDTISYLEKKFLALLSWGALLLGIGFLALLPLIIGDANRISQNLNKQFSQINEQQVAQVEQIEQGLNRATPNELENFFKLQNTDPKTANLSLPEKKYAYIQQLKAQRQVSYSATKSSLLQQQSKVKRDSVWLGLGAILAGLLLINVWIYSSWTRRKLS